MARKGWEQLTPKYRRSLERAGLTKAQYEQGQSLPDTERRKEARAISTWTQRFARLYSIDAEQIREDLAEYDRHTVYAGIQHQKAMQDAFHNGRTSDARRLWEQRDRTLPEWMHFYHGYFS